MQIQFSQTRLTAIDALRGLTILAMIWVNQLHGVADISPLWKHLPATADGMTFTDGVFASFLFIVGMSIPFAINTRRAKGDSWAQVLLHIALRTMGLWVIGLFLMNSEMGVDAMRTGLSGSLWILLALIAAILVWNSYPASLSRNAALALKGIGIVALVALAWIYVGADGGAMRPHWWGILGLIGWAYLYACLFYLLSQGRVLVVIACVLLISGFYMLASSSHWPQGAGLWSVLGGQAGNAAHTSIVLSGVAISLLMFNQQQAASLPTRMLRVIAFIALLTAVAFISRPYFPISKIIATPAWCFISVAVCTLIFLALYYFLDIKQHTAIMGFIKPAAANPLLIYLIPFILGCLSDLLHFPLTPEFATRGTLGILYALLFSAAMVWIVRWFNKAHIKLHL